MESVYVGICGPAQTHYLIPVRATVIDLRRDAIDALFKIARFNR